MSTLLLYEQFMNSTSLYMTDLISRSLCTSQSITYVYINDTPVRHDLDLGRKDTRSQGIMKPYRFSLRWALDVAQAFLTRWRARLFRWLGTIRNGLADDMV